MVCLTFNHARTVMYVQVLAMEVGEPARAVSERSAAITGKRAPVVRFVMRQNCMYRKASGALAVTDFSDGSAYHESGNEGWRGSQTLQAFLRLVRSCHRMEEHPLVRRHEGYQALKQRQNLHQRV